MKVLNILSTGNVGGEEVLCKDIGLYSSYHNTFCFLFGKGIVYDEMLLAGLNVIDLSITGKKVSLKKLMKLIRIAREHDIIVVHPGTFLAQSYFNLTSIFARKCKYVLTVHSCFEKDIYYFKNPLKTTLRKMALVKALRIADQIVFVSEAGKQSFVQEFNLRRNNLNVVYNGISLEKLNTGKNNYPSLKNTITLLYIGRLVKVKGVHLLIAAVEKLKKDYDIRLVIVGDGEERKALESLTGKLGLDKIISFAGQQRKLDSYYRGAHFLVYPSTWQEVFGISLVEAMAYGLPCIANNVGGIPEIIKDGRNGYLTQECTAAGIAAAISRAIKTGISDDMIACCKETADKFSIINTTDKLEMLYTSLLYQ